ncbi:MAG: LysM peptidoglycan-binding domain-containing protein [Chloroflexi bacterium]|nr:LysM peptidoglycan-binding domain-containing protein [Chloroflexota bacterium]
MKRELLVTLIVFGILGLLFWLGRAPTSPTQAQGEEPTKAPYVFPTPIFIPTFPPDPAATTSAPAPTSAPAAANNPTPARAADPGSSDRTYTIVSGDSPWIIAQKMYNDGTKYKIILDANNLTTSSKLKVGSTLIIPPLAGTPRPSAPTATSAAPTLAPIATAPTIAPTIAATGTLTATVPITTTVATTRTATGLLPPGVVSFAASAFNVLSVVAFIGSLATAVLALLAFERSRRFAVVESRKGRLTRRLSR